MPGPPTRATEFRQSPAVTSASATSVGVSDLSALATSACARRSRRPERASMFSLQGHPFLPATFWRVILDRMSDVTNILSAIERGDSSAAEQLLPLVYDELRKLAAQKLAQEKPGQTLQATALVHEAYLRLVYTEQARQWNGRAHFFRAAAQAMRRILVDRAREQQSQKRGGDWRQVDLDAAAAVVQSPQDDLVAVNDALEQL